jgi:hypothetical protein
LFILLQVLDLDRKIKRGRDRLAQDAATPLPNTVRKTEQLSALEENIKKMLVQVEEFGEAGKVDEAEALMKQVLICKINLFSLYYVQAPCHQFIQFSFTLFSG